MSHYETLGIPPDASADDVKRAYRASSSKAHPDKGGSNEDMAKVNRAYAVLSDPERRANYDAGTGDETDSRDDQIRKMLAELIGVVIDGGEANIVRGCEARIKNAKTEGNRAISRANSRLQKLQARRKSVAKKSGDGPNIVHAVIDKMIAVEESQIATSKAICSLMDDVLAILLNEYEHVPGQEPEIKGRDGDATFDEIMSMMAANKRYQARDFRGFQP